MKDASCRCLCHRNPLVMHAVDCCLWCPGCGRNMPRAHDQTACRAKPTSANGKPMTQAAERIRRLILLRLLKG